MQAAADFHTIREEEPSSGGQADAQPPLSDREDGEVSDGEDMELDSPLRPHAGSGVGADDDELPPPLPEGCVA